MFYLVKFGSNWADEFDCHGFVILQDRQLYDDFVSYYQTVTDEIDNVYFGSNEWFNWSNGPDMLRDFSITPICALQAEMLKSLLCTYRPKYGIIPFYNLVESMPL